MSFSDKHNVARLQVVGKCNKVNRTLTWSRAHPTGYLYNRKWVSRHCSAHSGNFEFSSCLQNTKVVLIGDSTVGQLFDGLKRRKPCTLLSRMKYGVNIRHRPLICTNKTLNYTLELIEHTLPFCASDTPRIYLRTFAAQLDLIRGEENVVVILHGFSHFLSYHSHVFYETLQNMRKGIVDLFNRKSNVFIVIKGPHTFSFEESHISTMWMPDRYADYYQQFIYDAFSDLQDRVMFLECQDITISTEQWHIHSEEFIIDALVASIFDHVCPY